MNTLRIFNHHVHTRVLLLGLLQSLLLVGSFYAAVFLRFGGQFNKLGESRLLLLMQALLFAAVVLSSMIAMGIYQPQRRESYLQVILQLLATFGLAVMGLLTVFYVVPVLHLDRGTTALAVLIAVSGSLPIQLWDYRAGKRHNAPWQILIYGAGRHAASILARLRRRSDQRFFTLSGCVPAPGEAVLVDSGLVRGTGESLLAYARSHGINEIVVAMDERRHGFPCDELMACRMAGINITDALTFYESQAGKVKTELLSPHWIIFSCGFRQSHLQDAVKRGLDVVFSLILLIVFSPVILLTVAAILLEDGPRAPILFAQTRVGRNGRDFRMLKFRSMRTDAEVKGTAQWAQKHDPRVTLCGSIMRRHRLDELPQLFNVIKGHMSLVGPRPERPEFVQQLSEHFPYYGVRHQVRPGITGWAQLGYPYGASQDDANAKLQFDLYYVKNRSTFLDFVILLRTVEAVLFQKGAR